MSRPPRIKPTPKPIKRGANGKIEIFNVALALLLIFIIGFLYFQEFRGGQPETQIEQPQEYGVESNGQIYTYQAKILSVYDGDTFDAEIDLGFGVKVYQRLRAYGVNTPELRGDEKQEGLRVRNIVRGLILEKQVTLKTLKDKKGKFGRYLAVVYVGEMNLNSYLIKNNLAKENYYGSKITLEEF